MEQSELESILLEFVADVEAVGVNEVESDWPDLVATYRRAKRALLQGGIAT